jgi:hypothetical protein
MALSHQAANDSQRPDSKPSQMSFYMNPDFILEDPKPAPGFAERSPRSRSPTGTPPPEHSIGEDTKGSHIGVRHPSLSSPGDWRALSQQVAQDAGPVRYKRRPSVREEQEAARQGRVLSSGDGAVGVGVGVGGPPQRRGPSEEGPGPVGPASDGGSDEGVSVGDIAQRHLVISTERQPPSPGPPMLSEQAVSRSVHPVFSFHQKLLFVCRARRFAAEAVGIYLPACRVRSTSRVLIVCTRSNRRIATRTTEWESENSACWLWYLLPYW